jgi:catechol 2,3-dioxygenase-like lactoylglutathione lyase family enzyme
MADQSFPGPGVELSTLLVVSDIDRSRHFYLNVLGAELVYEYGGTSLVFNFKGSWLIIVTGSGPTKDKPDTAFAPPPDPGRIDHELTIRVPDCHEAYEILTARGAEFLTPPVSYPGEIRCFFRDPDGHLLEISERID